MSRRFTYKFTTDIQLGTFQVFIHVVYALVAVTARKHFFDFLPTCFPDTAHHLVLGDLNTPVDPTLDEQVPYSHDLGRAELQSWMLELGVLDPWRATFPDRRVFFGPNQRNRIDYCLVTPGLHEESYRGSRYVTDKKWHHEDHFPLEFHLASSSRPDHKRLPWKCPRCLLSVPIVRETPNRTLTCLCTRLKCFPGSNPGLLLDEHKAADRDFLRDMQRALRSKDDKRLAQLRSDVLMAHTLDAVCSTLDTRSALEEACGSLKALEEHFTARREISKFDRDVSDGERGSALFFRSPTSSAHSVIIPSVSRPDDLATTDPAEMAAEHRHYWGSLFQSPSWDLAPTSMPRLHDPVALQQLLQHTTARLSEQDRCMLDAPLTANDFYWAICRL